MFDPADSLHVARFVRAFDYSYKTLEGIREKRMAAVEAYSGGEYSADTGEDRPVKFLRMAATIYQRQLVPRSPRVMVSTQHLALKDKAKAMKVWMDDRMEAMLLEDTIRKSVLDAFLKVGIVKVGLCVYDSIEYEGVTHDVGEPYVDPIDFDDFVIDLSVKRYEQVAFIGHRYRMPVDVAKQSRYFDGPAKGKIGPHDPSVNNPGGGTKIESLTHSGNWVEGEIEDMCEIWEIFFPREHIVVSFLADSNGGVTSDVLRVAPWKGPKGGPFHILGFIDVPGQVLPGGMSEDLIKLDELANRLFIKLGQQAERQKTVGLAPDSSDDAARIQTANDGDVKHISRPDAVTEMKFGGPDPNNAQFFLQVKQLFEFFGGNLGAIGGLGPQAETLGQDRLIQENSSKSVQEMQHRVIRFTDSILQSLAFYWWNDSLQVYEVERTIPKTKLTYRSRITPEDRANNFIRLNFRIDAYSMQPQTPQSKLNALMTLWGQAIMPLAGQMEQQGMTPNIEGFLRQAAQCLDYNELEELVQFAAASEDGPFPQAPKSQPDAPPMPAATTRTNVRVNRPGMTQQGGDQAMMQSLLGAANQHNNGAATGIS